MPAAQTGRQGLQAVDPLGHIGQRFAPEQLHIGLGGRDLLGRLGSAAKIKPGMAARAANDHARPQAGLLDLEVFAVMADFFFGPQPARDLHEFARARITLGLPALAVAIGLQRVLARHDVHAHPAAAQLVQRGRGGGELRRTPIARADGDQGLEAGAARRQRGGHREGVGPPPARAQQRAGPAMRLQRVDLARERLQAVVVLGGGIAAMPGIGLIGDVPKILGSSHACGRP